MTTRPCLGCAKLTANGTRCPTCQHQHRQHYANGWNQRSRTARTAHLAQHGPVCPGFQRPPHRVNPARLQLDHVTGMVLCNVCNVHAGPAAGRGVGGRVRP